MDRRLRLTLLGLVLLAAALRFPTLGVQSYWADEAATVDVLRHPLADLLGAVRDQESTPPLYYLLAWGWVQVLGDGEAALRALSALFGVATVPVVAAVAGRLGGARAALTAAALVATNPLLIWFSQEARAYALLVLLAALSLLTLLRALEDPSARRLLTWGAVVAAALATHFFALFLVLGEAVWLAYALRDRPRLVVRAGVLPVLAGLALLPLALDQRAGDRASFIGDEPLGTRLLQVPKQLLVGYDAPGELVAGVLAALVVVLAVAGLRRARPAVLPLAGVCAGALLLPLVLVAVGDDYLITRNLLAVSAGVLVVVAVGLAGLPRGAGIAAAACLAVVGAGTALAVQADDDYQRENWRDATAAVGRDATGRGRVVLVLPGSGRTAVEHYLPGTRLLRRPAIVDGLDVVAAAGTRADGQRSGLDLPVAIPGFGPPAPAQRGDTWAAERFRAVDAVGAQVDPGAIGVQLPGVVVLLQRAG